MRKAESVRYTYLEAGEIFGVEMAIGEQTEEDVRVGEEGEGAAAASGPWARQAGTLLGARELHSLAIALALALSVCSVSSSPEHRALSDGTEQKDIK